MYIRITFVKDNAVITEEITEEYYNLLKDFKHYKDFENGYIMNPLHDGNDIIFISFMKCENKKEFFFSKIHQAIVHYFLRSK